VGAAGASKTEYHGSVTSTYIFTRTIERREFIKKEEEAEACGERSAGDGWRFGAAGTITKACAKYST